MQRLGVMGAALLVVLALLAVPGASSAAGPEAVAPPAASPGVTWKKCADPELDYLGLQCGRLRVPLDHAKPSGAQITLALTRKLHTASPYQGVMLTNPGGPGGSGLSLPAMSDYVPGGVGERFDWIGMDPRGVGASTPSLHCSRRYFGYDRPSYVPRATWIYRSWLARARNYASACASTAGKRALLPHLTTLDTVRDMELVRRALGAEKLGFYGYSYGTYLGELYATRYPSRVGRFVLDGVVNPQRVWYAANFDQDRGFEASINQFWLYLAKHSRDFHLGTSWRAIRSGYFRQLTLLDRKPLVGGRLGPDELHDAMLDAAYYVYDWDTLGYAYADLVRRHQGATLVQRYRDGQPNDDNGFAVYNAVQCTDTAWPGWARTRSDTWAVHRRAPFATWGNTWYNAPCLTWRAPRHHKLVASGRAVSAKILLVNETRDAATPYSGALTTRRLFPSSSLVAGVGGTTHASSLSGVPCVDNAVAAYLRSGVVPARRSGNRADRSCPRLQPPVPLQIGRAQARAESGSPVDRMSPLLRRDLRAAQRGITQ